MSFTHVCVCVFIDIVSTYVLHAFSFCVSTESIHTSNCLPTRNALNLFALQTYFLHLLWQIIKNRIAYRLYYNIGHLIRFGNQEIWEFLCFCFFLVIETGTTETTGLEVRKNLGNGIVSCL